MALDTTRSHPLLTPDLHDDLREIKERAFRKYASPWVRIDAGATVTFAHGLLDFPHVADVLEAADSQGTGIASASSVTVTKNATVVTVVNGGAARFFRVRAF